MKGTSLTMKHAPMHVKVHVHPHLKSMNLTIRATGDPKNLIM
ncbi:hypothetical protein LINPERPRIM_LOCUS24745 [Linum perenne]